MSIQRQSDHPHTEPRLANCLIYWLPNMTNQIQPYILVMLLTDKTTVKQADKPEPLKHDLR